MELVLDHILLGINDLEKGIMEFEKRTSIKAKIGGRHPKFGTRNALLSLGEKAYLEIIAPINPTDVLPGPFTGFKNFDNLSVYGWALRTDNIEGLMEKLDQQNISHNGIQPGSRLKTDGTVLKWHCLFLNGKNILNPFFIQWEDMSLHPALNNPSGIDLNQLQYVQNSDMPLDILKYYSEFSPEEGREHRSGTLTEISLNSPNGHIAFRL